MKIRNRFLTSVLLSFIVISCSKKTDTGTNNNGGGTTPPVSTVATFTNPLLPSAPDPWVIQKDGNYYFTRTFGDRISIYQTTKMSALGNALPQTVYTPSATGLAYSKDIWAPEIHYLQGKWYIYFAADDGNDVNHRMYVLESDAASPISTYTFKGKLTPTTDRWAIDGTVLDYNNQLYLVWSGWRGDNDPGTQQLYIAKMSNPYTLTGDRVMISQSDYSWEKSGSFVNEGPEIVKNPQGRVFITYSASSCFTDNYALGLLTLKDGTDPMVAANWTKSATPVFSTKASNGAYGPGHNAFFKSADGKEDWLLYHANSTAGQGCGDTRNPRIQKFTWNTDGTPNFGEPVIINVKMQVPSGE
jgi:GH43 family beta-xylosidase